MKFWEISHKISKFQRFSAHAACHISLFSTNSLLIQLVTSNILLMVKFVFFSHHDTPSSVLDSLVAINRKLIGCVACTSYAERQPPKTDVCSSRKKLVADCRLTSLFSSMYPVGHFRSLDPAAQKEFPHFHVQNLYWFQSDGTGSRLHY